MYIGGDHKAHHGNTRLYYFYRDDSPAQVSAFADKSGMIIDGHLLAEPGAGRHKTIDELTAYLVERGYQLEVI